MNTLRNKISILQLTHIDGLSNVAAATASAGTAAAADGAAAEAPWS